MTFVLFLNIVIYILLIILKEDKFKRSNRWVDNFKKWHNLKQYNIHGEVTSVSFENLSTM